MSSENLVQWWTFSILHGTRALETGAQSDSRVQAIVPYGGGLVQGVVDIEVAPLQCAAHPEKGPSQSPSRFQVLRTV